MPAEAVARAHYRYRSRLARAAAELVTQAWRSVRLDDLDASWAAVEPRVLVAVTGAQQAAARVADDYLDEVLAAQRIDPAAAGRVAPARLAGVASDGRALDSLLRQSIVATKVALADGAAGARAMASGLAALDMIARTQVADAGRAADQVATTSRRRVRGYTRMTSGKACARCAILAGRWYPYNAAFNRHPLCQCVGIPTNEDRAGDLRTDPQAYFRSLPRAEQDRVFTTAGAEAIRSGADVTQVVNARRGMYTATAGGRDVQATREAAGRTVRLMPESIIAASNGDRVEAVRLLRLNGYLI